VLSHRWPDDLTVHWQTRRATGPAPVHVLGAGGDPPSTLGTWIGPAHLPQPSARTEVGSWLAASRSRWQARGRQSTKR
jgi:hypothetical protein